MTESNKLDVNKERLSLGFFPTPLSYLHNFSKALGGPKIYIKRDDMTGLAFGGNKTRKLEYLLADAIKNHSDCIITAGAAQSNHCRQTAAAAAQLNLPCHLLLGGHEPATANGNLLLDKLLGSHIYWQGEHRKGEGTVALFKTLTQQGYKPYVVPYGGSNEIGALGFVNAAYELEPQISHSPLSHIVFASSSGATHAGLMVGKELLKQQYTLLGIQIDKDENANSCFANTVLNLANETAALVGLQHVFDANSVTLNNDYTGDGYGVMGIAEQEAISLLAKTEGILVDPVYTGRALAGLIALVRGGQLTSADTVLFWHTGGSPALFDYAPQFTTNSK
ncbi:MAG: D-cysteine desulfhydrase family pyridoxal phosphate-dependent enzyme [Patiriisocius sp.]|jgi:D-cysteine desulfhydrase